MNKAFNILKIYFIIFLVFSSTTSTARPLISGQSPNVHSDLRAEILDLGFRNVLIEGCSINFSRDFEENASSFGATSFRIFFDIRSLDTDKANVFFAAEVDDTKLYVLSAPYVPMLQKPMQNLYLEIVRGVREEFDLKDWPKISDAETAVRREIYNFVISRYPRYELLNRYELNTPSGRRFTFESGITISHVNRAALERLAGALKTHMTSNKCIGI